MTSHFPTCEPTALSSPLYHHRRWPACSLECSHAVRSLWCPSRSSTSNGITGILLFDLGSAVDDLMYLKDIIEEPKFEASQAKILQLRYVQQQRCKGLLHPPSPSFSHLSSAWVLHYAVFIFYNVAEGPSQLLDFVFENGDRCVGCFNSVKLEALAPIARNTCISHEADTSRSCN